MAPAPAAAASTPDDLKAAAQFVEGGVLLRESATFLDANRILFGIVSEPAAPAKPARDVVLLLNSGTIHHIGPSRLYVTIARDCAARGMAAIRLDLSGVGDSGLRAGEKENSPYADSARLDVREAVEFAAKRYPGARVHIIGLCSGAYHGFKAAAAGLPLSSIMVVNPLTFFWHPGMSLEYAISRSRGDHPLRAQRAHSDLVAETVARRRGPAQCGPCVLDAIPGARKEFVA
jgi:hypothetical protein